MVLRHFRALLPIALCPVFLFGEVDIGETEAVVLERLGDPVGRIELQDKVLLMFPRGEVTLEDGLVTQLEIVAPAEYEAAQARRAKEREAWRAEQQRRKAARIEAGEALRAERMQSSTFAALPAKTRVDFWRRFQSRYPEIDVTEEIAAAVQSYEVELAELRTRERMAELEARVAEAEREAAAARLETQKLREEQELSWRRGYGLRYYTDPVLPPHQPTYRPPTITIHSDGSSGTIINRNGNTRH